MNFIKFLKNKGIIAAIFMAIFYQIIMLGSFLPGYSAIPNNMDELKVSIINEDQDYGKDIANQLKESLPFKDIDTDQSLQKSKELLDERDVHLVVHIPSDFSASLQEGKEEPKINFYINESNPTMISTSMSMIVDKINSQLSQEFSFNKAKGILAQMNVPEQQADELANSIGNSFNANIVTLNKTPDGMHNQMSPMFMTMVSYVGALIAALMLTGVFNGMKNILGKWRTFLYTQMVAILIAVVAPLIGIGILYFMHGYGAETFLHLWLHHALQLFVSLQFTLLFPLLFGQGGMLINLPLLLIQTVACGAVMSREMMYGFYRAISYISPMYYSVQADYSLLFGGGRLAEYEWSLLLIGIAAIALNALAVAFAHKDHSLPRKMDSGSAEMMPSHG